MFLFLQVLCTWWPGPWRWVKKESVLVLTDPILTPSWTQLEVVGWSYSMLEPPVLASLTLSPQATAFSGHSGERIIQGERKWGCRGWIGIQIQQGTSWIHIIQGERKWGHRGWVCIQIQRGPSWTPAGTLPCTAARLQKTHEVECGPQLVWPTTGVEVITTHNTVWVSQFGSWLDNFLFCFCFPLCSESYRNILLK